MHPWLATRMVLVHASTLRADLCREPRDAPCASAARSARPALQPRVPRQLSSAPAARAVQAQGHPVCSRRVRGGLGVARCTGMNRRNEALVLRYRDLHGLQHFATVLGPSPPARATPRAGGRRALLDLPRVQVHAEVLSRRPRHLDLPPACDLQLVILPHRARLRRQRARAPQPSPEVRDRDRGDQRVERLGAVAQSMPSA